MQKLMNRFHFQIILSVLVLLLLTGCGGTAQPSTTPVATASPTPPTWVSEVSAETLSTWIGAEREASIEGNLPLLASLWAEDGQIVDGRGSPTSDDDYVWAGRDAILDRYQLAVFPAPPPPLATTALEDATLTVDGDSAILVNNGDRWRFVRQDGRWWFQELVYSAPDTQ